MQQPNTVCIDYLTKVRKGHDYKTLIGKGGRRSIMACFNGKSWGKLWKVRIRPSKEMDNLSLSLLFCNIIDERIPKISLCSLHCY